MRSCVRMRSESTRALGQPRLTNPTRGDGALMGAYGNGMTEQFDRAYYQRFYVDPRTAVTSRAEMNARGRLIAAMADHIGMPVRSILDAGCGVGLLRAPLKRALPRATYTGMEVSEYLCRRHGWI